MEKTPRVDFIEAFKLEDPKSKEKYSQFVSIFVLLGSAFGISSNINFA